LKQSEPTSRSVSLKLKTFEDFQRTTRKKDWRKNEEITIRNED